MSRRPRHRTPSSRPPWTTSRRGWRVIPVNHRGKQPIGQAWQTQRLDEDGIRAAFAVPRNSGILLGEPSGGLVDVDLDCPEAAVMAGRLLPATASFGHGGKLGHLLYQADAEVKTRRFTAPDRTVLLELRSDGVQRLVPPSIHPSGGGGVEWLGERQPAQIEAAELERLVALAAAATLLARARPVQGSRHDASLALAGGLLMGRP